MLKLPFMFLMRATALWAAMVFSAAIAGAALGLEGSGGASDGPLSAEQAFLIVNALHAFILSVIAHNASARGFGLALIISITLFMAQSFLLVMEALYFIDSVKAPLDELLKGAANTGVVSVVAGGVSALLWRGPSEQQPTAPINGLVFRIAAVALLYIAAYFLAGFFIAWSAEDLRAYYADGVNIELAPLFAFQILRGVMWAVLALFIARRLKGPILLRAIIVGGAFSILATAQLLYPNPYMPWGVRLFHLVEVGISNFVFGALGVMILLSFLRSEKSTG